nr:hypothetical protein GCM10020063_041020 [Dactylosporangium thailandense]
MTGGFGPIGDVIRTALRRYPDRRAFVCGSQELSYAEAESLIARVIGLLRDNGVHAGDTVVQVRCNDPLQWLVAAACFVAGFRSTSLPPDAARLRAARPAAVLVGAALTAQLAEARDADPSVRWWCDGDVPGWRDLHAELDRRVEARVPMSAPAESVVRLAYTSRGVKPVELSSGALCAVSTLTLAQLDWPPAPRVLCPEQVSGGFGNMVVPTLVRGGTFIMLERFDVGALLDVVRRERPDVLLLMPPSLRALLSHPDVREADWSSLRLLCYSGAVLRPDEIDRAHDVFGPVLCGIFGQVEVPKTIAMATPSDHLSTDPRRRTSLGLPYPGMSVEIQDGQGRAVARGVAGELCVRGPTLMTGYATTAAVADPFRHGWLRTGDVCRMDEDGYLHYRNRLEDVLTVGAELVCPADLEDLVRSTVGHPAAVVKVGPDAVTVFVAGAPGDAVLRQARDALAGSRVRIAGVTGVDRLPVDAMGRVDRAALRMAPGGGSGGGHE